MVGGWGQTGKHSYTRPVLHLDQYNLMSTAPDSLPGLQIKCVLFLTKALQIHPYFWDSGSTHCLVYWGRVRKDKSCSSPANPPVKSFLLCSGPWHVLSQHAARSCSLSPYQNSQTGLLSVPSKHDTPHGIFFFFFFKSNAEKTVALGAMRTMQLFTFLVWFWLQRGSTTDSIFLIARLTGLYSLCSTCPVWM